MNQLLHRVRFRQDHRWAPAHMSDYLDAELSSGLGGRMERHLAECPECRRLLASLRTMLTTLQGLRSPGVDIDAARLAESVRLRIGEQPGPG